MDSPYRQSRFRAPRRRCKCDPNALPEPRLCAWHERTHLWRTAAREFGKVLILVLGGVLIAGALIAIVPVVLFLCGVDAKLNSFVSCVWGLAIFAGVLVYVVQRDIHGFTFIGWYRQLRRDRRESFEWVDDE